MAIGNENSPRTIEVIETFNATEVMKMIDEFDLLGKEVFESISSMDSLVAENIQTSSGAIGGKVGNLLFKEWMDNCVPLLNYSRFFSDTSETMRSIYNRSSETAETIERVYKSPTFDNAVPLNDSLKGKNSENDHRGAELL
ncbi:MAG: hypothetical protein ACI4XM_01665 [Candidatus Coprovivens sp.]